jgi:hypothetical protein
MSGESLLAQFDSEVISRCELIQATANAAMGNLRSTLELTLLGIPECVRKMPIRVLIGTFDGDIQRAVIHFSAPVVTQLGSGPGTQHGRVGKNHREPISPPPRISPRGKLHTKQWGVGNENASIRASDSPGERSLTTQTRTRVRSPRKP